MMVHVIWSETLLLKPSAMPELVPREEDLLRTGSGPGEDVPAEYQDMELLSQSSAVPTSMMIYLIFRI